MRTGKNIYLSDYLSVPMPRSATSHDDYLRKLRNRRILWALLPNLMQAALALMAAMLTMALVTVLFIGLGG